MDVAYDTRSVFVGTDVSLPLPAEETSPFLIQVPRPLVLIMLIGWSNSVAVDRPSSSPSPAGLSAIAVDAGASDAWAESR